jgi:hypothetical protein
MRSRSTRGERKMLSRREWIGRIAMLAGLAGLLRRAHAAETATKVAKAAAKYQNHPNAMQMCGMCKFYIARGGKAGSGMMGCQMGRGMMAAGTCELVEGQINPMGWCVLYRPISR